METARPVRRNFLKKKKETFSWRQRMRESVGEHEHIKIKKYQGYNVPCKST